MPIEISDEYIRIRVAKPGALQEPYNITWISRDKGIKAVVGTRKGKSATAVQSFLFVKEKWSIDKAKEWIADHDYKIQAADSDADIGLADLTAYAGESALVKLYDSNLESCSMNAEVALAEDPSTGDVLIKGFAITDTLIEDRKMRIPYTAWTWKDAFKLFNGRILGFHDDRSIPIGKVDSYRVEKDKGVYIEGRIFAENSPLMLRAIRSKVLQSFSIGFQMIEWSYDEKKEIVTIIRGMLKELSLVNIGADPNAGFNITNESNSKAKITTERSPKLSEPNENVALEKLEATQNDLHTKNEELMAIISTVREEQHKLAEGMITKAELQERMEKILKDVEVIAAEVQEAKTAANANDGKIAYLDYRSMLTDISWLTDDNGNKVCDVDQRAYCLFQLPVDYDKMNGGNDLRNLRDLHDAVLFSNTMLQYRNRGRPSYAVQKTELFKRFMKETDRFDHEVALAMAGGNTGYGAEWLPEELSTEFNEYLRQVPTLSNKFATWLMPKGGSAKFPFQNGKAVVYKGSEALVDNATEARKTNIATGVKTFTPDVFIGALISSEELTEDAILDMVSFIRKELAMALDEARESTLINGDDSATHFDNTVDTVYQVYNTETCWKGLRKLSQTVARDIEASSATTGVGALELINFTDAKMDMGIAGIKPGDCIYVTGLKGRSQTQTALFKEDALGVLAFMISGTLPTIDGSEIFISAQYDEALSSAGIRDSGADVKHTSMVCVHKPSFRLAQRRGITVEYNKDVLTQQQQFVVTARWDFGKICADAIVPVVGMENIQHTA